MSSEKKPKTAKIRVRITPAQKAVLDLFALAERTGAMVIALPEGKATRAYIVNTQSAPVK